jgi:hypothetical protein
MFASLLGTAVEEVFKHEEGWLTTKSHITKLKNKIPPCLFETLIQNKGDSKVKLLADAGVNNEEKDAFFSSSTRNSNTVCTGFLVRWSSKTIVNA